MEGGLSGTAEIIDPAVLVVDQRTPGGFVFAADVFAVDAHLEPVWFVEGGTSFVVYYGIVAAFSQKEVDHAEARWDTPPNVQNEGKFCSNNLPVAERVLAEQVQRVL